jgi:hypothetical protein
VLVAAIVPVVGGLGLTLFLRSLHGPRAVPSAALMGLAIAAFAFLAVVSVMSGAEIDRSALYEVAAAVAGGVYVLWVIGVGLAAAIHSGRK